MIKVTTKNGNEVVIRYFSCLAEYIAEDADCPSVLGRSYESGWAWNQYSNKGALNEYRANISELGQEEGESLTLEILGEKLFLAAKRGENGLLTVIVDGNRKDYTSSEEKPSFEEWYCKAVVGLNLAVSIDFVDEMYHEKQWD